MKLRLDGVELAAILGFCLIAFVATRPPFQRSGATLVEDDVLDLARGRFGPFKYSQGPEEWLIRDFFGDKREGVFVDIGAYEPVKWSNTYRLERDLGWRGVAVDALEEFAPMYRKERPRTRFMVAFVGDSDEGVSAIHVNPSEPAVSSATKAFTEIFTSRTAARDVRTRTLDSILEESAITSIDLLSMDIELGEPAALRHFSIGRYRPRLAVIEAHGETRQAILNYFAQAGYVVVGRYLHADPQNLYFAPIEDDGVKR
jgi:FkbM family methyltransferase